MEEQAEQGGLVAHVEGSSAENTTRDALKNSGWSHTAEAIKDKGVRDVQYADEKSGSGDDLPESRTSRGYCHLE